MPDARVTLRKSSPYRTRSNKFRKLRTPGGKLTIQYVRKLPSVPKCGDTGRPLFGVAVARPKELQRMSKRRKSVSRSYGGVLSAYAVRNRIIRAFLLEEQKIVKKVIKQQKAQKAKQAATDAAAAAASSKKKKGSSKSKGKK
ncbi:60S ribosomal protein L34-A [Gracilariopsis chorda]|uniref:Large ribosomal subunit protein eL34 n=1 Tax=Gracilariopsis chorda TaxID=448386 RepID=A0A2V3IRH2_9FLOR|nr:60S ribosomal protein L34-A [Gracilariopsis chorda]|eukprot:PXF44699.1 60S ribosomal protein L34-A [Gracilariopsis chorda]